MGRADDILESDKYHLTADEKELLLVLYNSRFGHGGGALERWLMDPKEQKAAASLAKKGLIEKGTASRGKIQYSLSYEGDKVAEDL